MHPWLKCRNLQASTEQSRRRSPPRECSSQKEKVEGKEGRETKRKLKLWALVALGWATVLAEYACSVWAEFTVPNPW